MKIRADGIQIIKATAEHVDIIAPLFAKYRLFYKRSLEPTATRAFVYARLDRQDSVFFLAVYARSLALGFAHLYPSFSSIAMKRLWILNDLFVIPVARNKGVAKRLMQSCRSLAIDTDACAVSLETAEDNLAARSLYEELGYQREEDFIQYQLKL